MVRKYIAIALACFATVGLASVNADAAPRHHRATTEMPSAYDETPQGASPSIYAYKFFGRSS